MNRTLVSLTVVVLVLGGACGNDKGSGPSVDGGGDDFATGALTYWDDVAPIVYDKCVRCHQEGGIGPFRLDTYADAKRMRAAAATAVKEGIMPPYYIDYSGSCGQFDATEALTEAQKKTIIDWAEGGAAEGNPRTLTRPAKPSLQSGTDFKGPRFAPVPQGGVVAQFDEYRCFPFDTGFTKDQFITGYDVLPGNNLIVHHAIVFVVDPARDVGNGKTNGDIMKALDEASPDRDGWPCFGAAGDGVTIDSAPVDWAPGQGVVNYPAKMGVRVRPGYKLVMQIHYNLADPTTAGMTDQTTARIRFVDSVERRVAFQLPDAFLDTLRAGSPDVLAPAQKSVKYTWKKTAAQLGLSQLPYADLVGIIPHMHTRGIGQVMLLKSGDADAGAQACASRLARWDFHWQHMYFYEETARPKFTPSSEIEVTCEYDTSAERAPVLPGWGTRNEMCLNVLMLALPPGI